jgi:hypothetical protein
MKYGFLTASLLGLSVWLITSAIALRSVSAQRRVIFSENPATVASYFGTYWTRLTTTNETGDRTITYTYNANQIRRFFADQKLELAVTFINDQAQSVTVGTRQLHSFQLKPLTEEDYPNYYPSQFDELFKIIFGETPSANFPLHGQAIADDSGDGGTFHSTTHCVVEGIAVQSDWISERDLITKIKFMPETRCQLSEENTQR